MGCGYGDYDEPCENCGRYWKEGVHSCGSIREQLEWALIAIKKAREKGVVLEGVTDERFQEAVDVYRQNHQRDRKYIRW